MQHGTSATPTNTSRAHPLAAASWVLAIAVSGLGGVAVAVGVVTAPAEGPLSFQQREALAHELAVECGASAAEGDARQLAQFAARGRPSTTRMGVVRAHLPPGGAQSLSGWKLEAQSLDGLRVAQEFGANASVGELALPFGTWRVRPVADGYTARAQLALIRRGASERALSFQLESAATVVGILEDSSGTTLPHTRLSLESCADGLVFTAVTAADGSFVFEDVLCGEFRWRAGEPDAPLDINSLRLRRAGDDAPAWPCAGSAAPRFSLRAVRPARR